MLNEQNTILYFYYAIMWHKISFYRAPLFYDNIKCSFCTRYKYNSPSNTLNTSAVRIVSNNQLA